MMGSLSEIVPSVMMIINELDMQVQIKQIATDTAHVQFDTLAARTIATRYLLEAGLAVRYTEERVLEASF